jgi:hypothetical protein
MPTSASPRGARRRALAWTPLAAACCLAAVIAAPARAAIIARSSAPASATLVACVTSVEQAERSATFAGEMTLVPGSTRMAMRVDIEKRAPREASFHLVSAPGLGVWRSSEAKVKVYRYLKQVTNLEPPAFYRAVVHFRWMSAKGLVVKRAVRHTRPCAQPAAPPHEPPPVIAPAS